MTPIPSQRMWALAAFRWSVFFVLAVAAFSERDQHTQTILISIVFAADVVSRLLGESISMVGAAVYNQVWMDTLANRFIFQKLVENIQQKQQIDPESLIKEGTIAARDDIQKFLRDEHPWSQWGKFKKTIHGIGYFLWWWLSYGVFYWFAAFLRQGTR
jgi:hypothetical protein